MRIVLVFYVIVQFFCVLYSYHPWACMFVLGVPVVSSLRWGNKLEESQFLDFFLFVQLLFQLSLLIYRSVSCVVYEVFSTLRIILERFLGRVLLWANAHRRISFFFSRSNLAYSESSSTNVRVIVSAPLFKYCADLSWILLLFRFLMAQVLISVSLLALLFLFSVLFLPPFIHSSLVLLIRYLGHS